MNGYSPTVGEYRPLLLDEFHREDAAQLAALRAYHTMEFVGLRANLSGNPRFVDVLADTDGTVYPAPENRDYPLPLVVERLQRSPGRSPFFDTIGHSRRGRQCVPRHARSGRPTRHPLMTLSAETR